VVAIVQVLAYDKLLPSILTDNQDRNELILSLITYYVVLAGVASYDFKTNLFISSPATVISAYFMARTQEKV